MPVLVWDWIVLFTPTAAAIAAMIAIGRIRSD